MDWNNVSNYPQLVIASSKVRCQVAKKDTHLLGVRHRQYAANTEQGTEEKIKTINQRKKGKILLLKAQQIHIFVRFLFGRVYTNTSMHITVTSFVNFDWEIVTILAVFIQLLKD